MRRDRRRSRLTSGRAPVRRARRLPHFDFDSMTIIRDMPRAGRCQVANDSPHRQRKLLLAIIVWSVLAVTSTNAAAADDGASSPSSTHGSGIFSPQELSFRFAYGMGNKESLDFYTFGPRVGPPVQAVARATVNRAAASRNRSAEATR